MPREIVQLVFSYVYDSILRYAYGNTRRQINEND